MVCSHRGTRRYPFVVRQGFNNSLIFIIISFIVSFIVMSEYEQSFQNSPQHSNSPITQSNQLSSKQSLKQLKNDQLKSLILEHQSSQQKGYYTFPDWKQLHTSLFLITQSLLTNTVINGWRILKLINFGDDYVPTGLVYDMMITVINVQQNVQETQYLLKRIFFKFIQFNGKFLSQKEKEELAFFRVIRSLAEGYRKIVFYSTDQQTKNQHQEPPPLHKQDRNTQLYQLHNVYTYKKNLVALKKIDEEFKQCTFEPQISPKSESMQARYLEPKGYRQNLSQSLADITIDEEDQFQESCRIPRANPLPYYPQVVPIGLNEHMNRMQKSRQIKRINSLKPYKTSSNNLNQTQQISQFTIDQRQSQLKEKYLSHSKLLFIIKVQVGKKLYRLKVRQGMSVNDVVRNIQMMMGFSDEGLGDVVREYFGNWEKREKLKSRGNFY